MKNQISQGASVPGVQSPTNGSATGCDATVRELRNEVERLRQAHWDGRAVGGFDNDGDPTPRALVSDFADLIRRDWRDAREAYEEVLAEAAALEHALAERTRERDGARQALGGFPTFHLAQLRHLYSQMVGGAVICPAAAAKGLLGPAVRALEDFDKARSLAAKETP